MRRDTALLLVLPMLLATCAGSTSEQDAGFERHMAGARAALAAKADPDSLATAALMSVGTHSQESLDLMKRAVAMARDRPDPEPSERRLRQLDPANGAAWLGALARAESMGDESAKDAALAAISRAPRVDIYWTTLIARLSNATAQTGATSLGEAEVDVIGLLAALPIPAYSIASKSCNGERLKRPGVLEVCRGVAKAFEAGDTYFTEMVGIVIAKRVWPEQSPEWQAATEARRVFEYRGKLGDKIAVDPSSEQAVKNYLALCAQNHREQDVNRAQLVAAGEAPDPPRE